MNFGEGSSPKGERLDLPVHVIKQGPCGSPLSEACDCPPAPVHLLVTLISSIVLDVSSKWDKI